MSNVVVKGVVAQSTFDFIKQQYGLDVWEQCLSRLSDADRIAVNAGVNVPLQSMGAFNEAFVVVACNGSRTMAQAEFRKMGAASAEKLLTGNGIFSIFARLVTPKQVFTRAASVITSAYPGCDVQVELDSDESGGIITMRGMSGYPYGSQRVVGWLLRGIELVGGKNARVTERNWDAGQTDSDTYTIVLHWDA
ncbi:MAG: hypothetical protein CVT59_06325 [Actinobacteria bacterium HGW-Actinobacteria-1]|nr:MAG: hypothetical protein CVT59_06325 [Actinobacteria bacterium HGW-Actinobacteria-1]